MEEAKKKRKREEPEFDGVGVDEVVRPGGRPRPKESDKHVPSREELRVRFALRGLRNAEEERNSFCARLRLHGWAIVELDPHDSGIVQRASEAAERFFLRSTQEQKEVTRLLFDEVAGNKGLVGYNDPTPAKEVYRLRRGPTQPWPSTLERGVFQAPVEEAFALLEGILATAMRWIASDLAPAEEPDHLLQRYCCTRHGRGTEGDRPEALVHDRRGDGPVGADAMRFDTSPFDLFYYKNTEEARHLVNCHRHVDPGFMTVVPCAVTPGLEVLDAATMEWLSVELEGQAHRDVTLFCGQSLQTVSDGAYPGIVHCVGKSSRPRLSLVYEIRPQLKTDSCRQ